MAADCYIVNGRLADALAAIRDNPGFGSVRMSSITGINRDTWTEYVKILADYGLLEKVPGRSKLAFKLSDRGLVALYLIESIRAIAPEGVRA